MTNEEREEIMASSLVMIEGESVEEADIDRILALVEDDKAGLVQFWQDTTDGAWYCLIVNPAKGEMFMRLGKRSLLNAVLTKMMDGPTPDEAQMGWSVIPEDEWPEGVEVSE